MNRNDPIKRTGRIPKMIVLDMDSDVRPGHGASPQRQPGQSPAYKGGARCMTRLHGNRPAFTTDAQHELPDKT